VQRKPATQSGNVVVRLLSCQQVSLKVTTLSVVYTNVKQPALTLGSVFILLLRNNPSKVSTHDALTTICFMRTFVRVRII
jgi:hypothetical protein